MKRFLPVLFFALIFGGVIHKALADDGLQNAIGGTQRSEANKNRDGARHPLETLRFFGISPKMTVVELSPGGGWYTEILAPYLQQHGQLIEALQDPESESEYGRKSFVKFKEKLDGNLSVYGKVTTAIFEPPVNVNFAPNDSVDMVITFRNIHNWIIGGDDNMKLLFKSVYSSLKKGGVFGVVEHRLPVGQVQDANASTGYVSEAYVIKMAESVGFKLAAKSEINANSKDNALHEGGVWALPPTYANHDKDRQQYTDIGESDRMTLRFVK
jgi:predicted methyltransferase